MNLLEFINQFPDEASCRQRLKEVREKEGVECKKCGCQEHYWLSTLEQFKCKQCGFRTTLRSGTVMEHSKLPVRYWFIAMHLLASTKKSFSALELQRQLGHKRYQPIWEMLHKLRMVMGKRDEGYQMEEYVEVDEGFFEVVRDKPEQEESDDENESQKRGRGSQKQDPVLVMVESVPMPKGQSTSKHQPNQKVRHAKMIRLDDLTASSIDYEAEKHIDKTSTVKTDGFSSYTNLKHKVKKHTQIIAKGEEATKELPWVHTLISNAKRLFLGIHHMIKDIYLENYLAEFCYKFNRRYMRENLFDRMLVAAVSNSWY